MRDVCNNIINSIKHLKRLENTMKISSIYPVFNDKKNHNLLIKMKLAFKENILRLNLKIKKRKKR